MHFIELSEKETSQVILPSQPLQEQDVPKPLFGFLMKISIYP